MSLHGRHDWGMLTFVRLFQIFWWDFGPGGPGDFSMDIGLFASHRGCPVLRDFRGQKINTNFFCTKFFENPSGYGRKSWTSAPKSVFPAGRWREETFWPLGVQGVRTECPQEVLSKKFVFNFMFLFSSLNFWAIFAFMACPPHRRFPMIII